MDLAGLDPFICCVLTSVSVRLRAVAVLQPVCPGALILGWGAGGLADPVPALEALRPLPPVEPLASTLHPQAMSLPVLPVTFEVAPAGTEKHNQ